MGGSRPNYEVIIAGASFAGLAVAAQLGGRRMLIVDRKPVGTGQTSACGTPLATLQALGAENAVEQVHHRLVLHTPGHTFDFPLLEPFCTFDYTRVCRYLANRTDGEVIRATALRIEDGHVLHTTAGAYSADIIVDATGWRAALGGQFVNELVRHDRLNFGIEASVAYRGEGLHFWYPPGAPLAQAVAWLFPAGERSRAGVASYRGETRVRDALERLTGPIGGRHEALHGGFFPHAVRDPVVGPLLLVGDAAGQCLGLTGEGIRPALFFGTRLGDLLRRMLDGEIAPGEAKTAYRRLVGARKPGYELLCLAQRVVPRLPLPAVEGLLWLASHPPLVDWWQRLYLAAFRLDHPERRVVEERGGPAFGT